MTNPPRVSPARVFRALLFRDIVVARRELPFFLLRTTLQPLMFVLVFGYLLPRMGFIKGDYGATLLPGILGISLAFASLQSVALPMVSEFGWTREIEDRLLAPVPIRLVALAKVTSGILQGVIAALFVLPIARGIMGPIPGLDVTHLGLVLLVTLLGAAAFSMVGLFLGSLIEPAQIGLMFGFVVAPMIFFGCAYYPWHGLDGLPVLQVAVLVNPLVYVSEGMRGVLTPGLPHMHLAAVILALVAITVFVGAAGLRSFERRAIG